MKSLKQMLTLVNNKKIDYKALVYSQFHRHNKKLY